MKYAIHAPNFATYSDPRAVVDLAREAEDAGWDGFFLWDHLLWTAPQPEPVADTGTQLAAIAARTSRITLGPLITPLPRRRPWTVARQALTVDHLSGGRLVLGVGIGGDWFGDYSAFGEPSDNVTHGAMLDEALAIITGLWSGEPFRFSGAHYQVHDALFLPRLVQQPRIPIWVAGVWPHKKPVRRAAQWDGVAPEASSGREPLTPTEIRDLRAYIQAHRQASGPFDVTHIGRTPGDDPARAADLVTPYAEAGVTWWLERVGDRQDALDTMRPRVRQGPPQTR
jgi:alkanesulfonate monooxygenase SsuD/methylene tetrahydromethanopterin reductase-like flavin-dependent oxidoreductase (luciferase family)